MTSIKRWISIACAGALMAFTMTVAAQNLSLTHNANIEYVGHDSAEIAWTTNAGGSSVIRYGTDPNNLNQTAEESYQNGQNGQHVTHRVLIKGLQSNTTYYFRVESAQGQGTGTAAEGQVRSFRTKAQGQAGSRGTDYGPAGTQMQQPNAQRLTITNGPNIEYVGKDSAQIAWTTNAGGSSVIHYGTNPNSLNQTAQESYQAGQSGRHVTHRVTVNGLQPNTTYYYRVDSGQGEGTGTEAESQVQSFRTKAQ